MSQVAKAVPMMQFWTSRNTVYVRRPRKKGTPQRRCVQWGALTCQYRSPHPRQKRGPNACPNDTLQRIDGCVRGTLRVLLSDFATLPAAAKRDEHYAEVQHLARGLRTLRNTATGLRAAVLSHDAATVSGLSSSSKSRAVRHHMRVCRWCTISRTPSLAHHRHHHPPTALQCPRWNPRERFCTCHQGRH